MKISYIFSSIALSLCLASCYEIGDLEQDFNKQYKPAVISGFESASNYSDQITYTRLYINVEHFKSECKLQVHYTDVEGADPFVDGNAIDITSCLEHPINDFYYNIIYELNNLMPETRYWAGVSYSDPGCETLRTKVLNFMTEGFQRRCGCYDYGSDYMVVVPSFRYIPSGCTYGCLIGSESNLTLDNCLESREVGHRAIEGNEESYHERFEGLQKGATYYYRSYVTYRGRTYYSRVYERQLESYPW